MLDFLFKGKKKVAIRSQIVDLIIADLIKSEAGDHVDECGNTWTERSFNEIIEYFNNNVPSSNFATISKNIHNWVKDMKNPTYCETYNVLHNVYFGKCATEYEKDKLRYEFKKELKVKGLRDVFEKHSAVKWKYHEKR